VGAALAKGGGSVIIALVLLAAVTPRAAAQCVPTTAPTSGTTVTCSGSSTTPVVAVAGSTGVTINVDSGASVSGSHVAAVPFPVLGVDQSSTITNNGLLNLTGGAGSGTNRGAAMLGNTNSNNLTNSVSAIIATTGAFNDGMAANGSGNTLTNNGTITTTGPNAYGMTAAWGQANTGQLNNTLINTGNVSTSGSNARAASILGGSSTINNSGTLSTTGTAATAAYLQGNADRLINSGTIVASGSGSFAVDSNTVGSSFTASIQNTGSITSTNGTAIRTLNGNTTIINAGTITGGGGTAISMGNGNDSLVLQTGSAINGLVDGGAGTNTLTLQGTGTASNPFLNFQTLTMQGTQWTWNGTGSFTTVQVQTGTLIVGDASNPGAALAGTNITVASGSTLGGYGSVTGAVANNGTVAVGNAVPALSGGPNGAFNINGSLLNSGVVNLAGSAIGNQLNVAGNYVGANGVLNVKTVLAGDGSPSDKLVISGGAGSGSTSISVNNVGGAGAQTFLDGILLVQAVNGATTTSTAFSLSGPVVAGAYDYYLFKRGVTIGTQESWFLRSSVAAGLGVPPPIPAPGTPPLPAAIPGAAPIPLYRPEVAVQSVVPSVVRTLGLVALGTFNERQGTQSLLNDDVTSAGWGRVFGQNSREQFGQGAMPSFDGTYTGLQVGRDVWRFESLDGHRDHVGLYFAYAHASGGVHGFVDGWQNAPAGNVELDAESLGGYWTHIGPSNWYVDTVVQGTTMDGSGHSERAIGNNLSARGVTASVESGCPIPLAPWLTIEPQAQAIWQHFSIGGTADQYSTITFSNADVFTGRAGGLLQGTFGSSGAFWQPYLKGNVWWGSSGTDVVTFAAADPIPTGRNGGEAVEGGGGIAGKLTRFVSIYGDASYLSSVNGPRLTTIKGNIGLRVTW
jgi:type V secretory pathway adhesin AidA